jgi:hypothetical protein
MRRTSELNLSAGWIFGDRKGLGALSAIEPEIDLAGLNVSHDGSLL